MVEGRRAQRTDERSGARIEGTRGYAGSSHNLPNGELSTLLFQKEKFRTRLLDKYFLYTSSLGTHTFFMTVLPCLFFFGHTDTARG